MSDEFDLEAACGRWFKLRDLIECGDTWRRYSATEKRVPNVPLQRDTFGALVELSTHVLDPLADQFGRPVLTYGFASPGLTNLIERGIAPRLDQHASCEVKGDGAPICSRRGAAVDLQVPGVAADVVARWLIANIRFDRLYFYGTDRPLHVSHGPQHARAAFAMARSSTGGLLPRRYGP